MSCIIQHLLNNDNDRKLVKNTLDLIGNMINQPLIYYNLFNRTLHFYISSDYLIYIMHVTDFHDFFHRQRNKDNNLEINKSC